MDVEIKDYTGEGYKPVVDFNCWRVAYIHSSVNMKKSDLEKFERHLETDEIFVLLNGSAVLLTAGKGKKPSDKITELKMKKGVVYNVKKSVWHSVLLKKNTKILIVENKNTTTKNSEYVMI